ncbi:MAG: hypothetical protein JNN18_06440 [Rubrivivax sp.]|nr:hypothetical protein [Rubrivivax sp.]
MALFTLICTSGSDGSVFVEHVEGPNLNRAIAALNDDSDWNPENSVECAFEGELIPIDFTRTRD